MLTPEPSLIVATSNMGRKGGSGFTATTRSGIAALGYGIYTLVLAADNMVSAVILAEN